MLLVKAICDSLCFQPKYRKVEPIKVTGSPTVSSRSECTETLSTFGSKPTKDAVAFLRKTVKPKVFSSTSSGMPRSEEIVSYLDNVKACERKGIANSVDVIMDPIAYGYEWRGGNRPHRTRRYLLLVHFFYTPFPLTPFPLSHIYSSHVFCVQQKVCTSRHSCHGCRWRV